MIYSNVTESKLMSLDFNQRIALLAIARAMKTNLAIPISTAEKTYAVVCEEYQTTPRKHTQFWTYIQKMEGQGLLRTEVVSDGGRTTMISLPDIPSKVLATKLESLMEVKGNEM